MKGTVVSMRPELRDRRLSAVATVKTESGELLEAHMPDRELSVILPRSVLLGTSRKAPLSLLDTIAPILSRMAEGRIVRAWKFRERWFFSFQQWRGVRFEDVPAGASAGRAVTDAPAQPATPP
ncbi:MAG TPA: hypothetical protein VMV03_11365 [Spirochaetia bacterium]|nr:hypothetical protein [Spirochaetia bacterium]